MAKWENEWISLSVLSVARVQFPAVAENFKGFPLADHTHARTHTHTHTRRGDGCCQVITSPLKGYEEFETIQLLLSQGPPPGDRNGHQSSVISELHSRTYTVHASLTCN